MNVQIKDDFDLHKIMNSGQCFRVTCENDTYRFIHGKHILYIRHKEGIHYEISCSRYAWNHIWKPYFDLSVSYKELGHRIPSSDSYLQEAYTFSRGIRILHQDPFEMVITFIISQRKSIPAIRSAVEKLSQAAGTPIDEEKTIYAFPTISELSRLSTDELKACSLGYRAPYIYETVRKLKKMPHLLKGMEDMDDTELLAALMDLPGVGIKVASCAALFGFHRKSMAPVDVWIDRIIQQKYNGKNPFPQWGEDSGIIQQYLFYYAQQTHMK